MKLMKNVMEYLCNFISTIWLYFISEIIPIIESCRDNLLDMVPKKKVNLLLVGPTGVGKSTFINAFVNYLQFKDLNQAKKSELHFLIPGAFTVYENDYQTRTVKFGEENANENTEAQGQSATQNCKSYKIEVDDLALNLIDSPGFGDTRGEEQDTANVNHIIDYVAPYDNFVIGVLLKPNEARLTAAFEDCMRQLLSHLYLNANREIVFIFTNTRSFSYLPGDTINPLKEMLQKLQQPLGEIKFSKENVFCMDNEAFRYLVARRNGVTFNTDVYDGFKESWQKSAEECNRMINYITGETPSVLIWKKCLIIGGTVGVAVIILLLALIHLYIKCICKLFCIVKDRLKVERIFENC